MKNNTYLKQAGLIMLISWILIAPSLAAPVSHGESLAYSPDRWPARWSAIIRQNQAIDARQTNATGRYTTQTVRQENPWAHDSSVLFSVPSGHRPWGEPPRKTYRQRTRSQSYRDQRRPVYRQPTLHQPAYGAGIMPQTMTGMAYPSAYGIPAVPGLGYPLPYGYGYGVSPLLGSPLLAPPLLGYPYTAYPLGMRGMNWPFGAW